MQTSTTLAQTKRAYPFGRDEPLDGGLNALNVTWNTNPADDLPPHWSRARDRWLRQFWRMTDPIKAAVYTFTSKVLSIPFAVHPNNWTVSEHVRLAALFTDNLRANSGLMAGWRVTLTRFIQDYLTQDNGAFLFVMGEAPADRPLDSMALGVAHLDSARCTRTRSPEYPVTYRDRDGKLYQLHFTRVIAMANLSSPELELNGVGLCAVSIAIGAGREEAAIQRYTLEKLGSRPQRALLYIRQGGTIDQLQAAISAADAKMDADGLTTFARTLLMAPRTSQGTLDIEQLPLANLPDGFNRMDSAMLNTSRIAAAFGLDTRDLAFAMGPANTRADAEVQDRKGRGKGVGEFIESLADNLDHFVLPDALHAAFDYVDDEADRAAAQIRGLRSDARKSDLTAGVTDIRLERELMVQAGEVTQDQFEDLELRDGRLDDGSDVLMLFAKPDDATMATLLNLGVADPTDITANDATTMVTAIETRRGEVFAFIRGAESARRRRLGKRALAALDKLEALYQEQRAADEAAAALAPDNLVPDAADTGDVADALDNLDDSGLQATPATAKSLFHANGHVTP